MILNIIDSVILGLMILLVFMQGGWEATVQKNFWAITGVWALAFFIGVTFGFKVIERFFNDPASLLDIFKHIAFLLIAGRCYMLSLQSKWGKNSTF